MDEKKCIEQCKHGDFSGFKALFDRYNQPLFRTALRMLGSRHDAEDAVQKTFIRLFRSISQFAGRSAFSSYLFRILINVCYDMLKVRKRMKTAPLEQLPDTAVNDPSEMIGLAVAIDSLPPQMKACFSLFAVEGMRKEDIAAIMNLSVGGVKSNIYHAKRKLRLMLKEGAAA